MPDLLPPLLTQREAILCQIAELGDMRRGTITEVFRSCGKSGCCCSERKHPGHGPYYAFTTKVEGKTKTLQLRPGPRLAKIEREVETYKRFRFLTQQLLQVNEGICNARPEEPAADSEKTALKKPHATRPRGVRTGSRAFALTRCARERSSRPRRSRGNRDGRAELDARDGWCPAGKAARCGRWVSGHRIDCGKGHLATFVDHRSKTLRTVLSKVELRRAYYHCPDCQQGSIPRDRELDIVATSFSPGVRRLMGRVGSKEPFDEGRQDLELLAGIVVNTKEVERVSERLGQQVEAIAGKERKLVLSGKIVRIKPVPKMYIAIDGTGVPMVPHETQGRQGKDDSGMAKSREAKLGCVFTQTSLDDEGFALRDPDSTTYVGAIETAEEFGQRIFTEAIRRGLRFAEQVIVIGDGAPWIWNLAAEHFADATEILDLYHTREHVSDLAKVLYEPLQAKAWTEASIQLLDEANLEGLLSTFARLRPKSEFVKDELRKATAYFQTNTERMRYQRFREQGLFVGSGVVEAACKTIVGRRLKQSGMRWTVRGANAIIALRCCELSRRWEQFWEARCG